MKTALDSSPDTSPSRSLTDNPESGAVLLQGGQGPTDLLQVLHRALLLAATQVQGRELLSFTFLLGKLPDLPLHSCS